MPIPSMRIDKIYYVHVDHFCFTVPNDTTQITPTDIRKKVLYGNRMKSNVVFESGDKDRAMQVFESRKQFCSTYKQTGFLTSEVSGDCCYIEAKTQNQRGEHIANLGVLDFFAEELNDTEADVSPLF